MSASDSRCAMALISRQMGGFHPSLAPFPSTPRIFHIPLYIHSPYLLLFFSSKTSYLVSQSPFPFPSTMAAASATSTLFKPLSMAEGCLFTAKSSYPFLALPSKPLKVTHLSSSASSPSWVSLRNKFSSSNLIPLVASTSDWAGEESQVKEDEFKWDGDSLEGAVDSGDEEGGVVESGSEDEESGGYPEPPEEAKLFVGNLPYDIDSEKLAQLFEQSGTVEIAEVIYNRETDQSRGFGFVTMSTVEEAEKAVEAFHQYDINGRLLTVNKAAPRGSRPERPPRSFGPSLRLYVGNLPWQVDDSQLKQVFSEHGQVIDARVVFDRETGRSRGFGFVTMASQTELDDAIAAMDGQSLDGRAIRVNVAEERPRRTF